ncbi:MAG TPA: FtsX-like permease family protein, partial [Chryseolinea sp.]|nr:FtsX-like permease family protein [Chryseolinea sp.]
TEGDLKSATSLALLANVLKEYPEVESTLRLEVSPKIVKLGDNVFSEKNFYKAEQSVFEIFTFHFVEGTPEGALDKPNSIVITSSIASKYFRTASALGNTLHCNGEDFVVTGVVSDRPFNSDMQIDALFSFDFSKITTWAEDFSAFTFILFKERPDLHSFKIKIADIDERFIQPEFKALDLNYRAEFELESLRDVHFSKGKIGDTRKGDKEMDFIFSLLAAFILMIALLNYVTLSTARAVERAKEVGIRKVSGALRAQMVWQFLFESFIIVFLSWLFAIVLVVVSLPHVNALVQTRLSIFDIPIYYFLGLFFITFILSGLYPSFVLSGFRPIEVLKGSFKNSSKGVWLRKSVTVLQFAIAGGLIMCTTVIYTQMRYIQQKDLGFNEDQLVTINLPDDSTSRSSAIAFKNELQSRPEVHGVTVGSRLDGLGLAPATIEVNGKEKQFPCNFYQVDEHYLPVFQIKLSEGRNFSMDYATDKREAVIVNEAFVKMSGWSSAIGQEVHGFDRKGKVIGVVKNYYYKSLHNVVEPLVLVYNNNPQVNATTIKVTGYDLDAIEKLFRNYFPSEFFDYAFFDDVVNEYYRKEQITLSLFNSFTVLSILISCLGLYSLVSLIIVQRSKEISMRKVLGASLSELFIMMSMDFARPVLVSLIISLPIAGILMNRWLSAYAYHVSLSWWMFLVVFLLVLIIILAVISREVIKIAMIKPIDNLRVD